MWWSSLVLVPSVALGCGPRTAVGFSGGLLWSLANVWVMMGLTKPLASPRRIPAWKTAGLWLVKGPVLYAIGAILIVSPWSSAIAFLAGFSWWFVLLVVSAIRVAAGSRHGLV